MQKHRPLLWLSFVFLTAALVLYALVAFYAVWYAMWEVSFVDGSIALIGASDLLNMWYILLPLFLLAAAVVCSFLSALRSNRKAGITAICLAFGSGISYFLIPKQALAVSFYILYKRFLPARLLSLPLPLFRWLFLIGFALLCLAIVLSLRTERTYWRNRCD